MQKVESVMKKVRRATARWNPHKDPDFVRRRDSYIPCTMPQAIRDIGEHTASKAESILVGTGISTPRLQAMANGLASEIRKAARRKAKRVEARL